MPKLDFIDRFVTDLMRCDDVDLVTPLVRKYLTELGYDAFSYIRFGIKQELNSPDVTPDNVFYIAWGSKAWEEHYVRESLHVYDPVSRIALRRGVPVTWDEASRLDSQTPQPRRVLSEARDFDLRNGFAVPAFSADGSCGMFGALSRLESESFEPLYGETHHLAHLLAIHLHHRIGDLCADDQSGAPVRLSGREIEVLLWTASGKTVWEIGQILNLSEHTVDFHVRNAMKKFGVHTKTQAVARMIQMRMAQP